MPRILLVEDNLMNRDMLSRRLERRGFEILSAADGVEGVKLTKEQLPDLVLMDMSLPLMDGYEATRLLKADPKSRHVPILGLSAHAMAGDAEKALAAGCDGYDTKPVEFKRLVEKIDELLARAARARQGGAAEVAASGPTIPPLAGKVLLATDVPLLRDALQRRLAGLGLEVALLDDRARLALALAEAGDLEAVLVSAGWLANTTAIPAGGPPLVAVLEAETTEQVVQALRRGARDVVVAPFPAEVLRSRLAAALEAHRTQERVTGLESELAEARGRAEGLLRALLPPVAVEELTRTRRVEPREHAHTAVLFADLVGFGGLCARRGAQQAIGLLQRWFVSCEEIAAQHGVQKLKTSGDAFIGVVGLEDETAMRNGAGATAAVRCALALRAAAPALEPELVLRAGIHVGPLVTGVVGRSSFLFDAWGETVKVASRLEAVAGANAVYVSTDVWRQLPSPQGALVGRLPRPEAQPLDVFRVDALGG